MEIIVPPCLCDKISEQCGDKTCDGLVLRVPHKQQVCDWDCGIVCLQMSAAFLHLPEDALKNVIEKHNMKQNVWTIDLAYLCMFLGVKHQMFTLTMGVDDLYVNEPFYTEKLCFDTETVRVNKLFATVCENKVCAKKKNQHLESIISHIIIHKQPVIVLIDSPQLQTIQEEDSLIDIMKSLNIAVDKSDTNQEINSCYFGHFVLVVGFDLKDQQMFYHDPSKTDGFSACSFNTFERARNSFGTDKDILFIFPPATS